MMKSKISGFFAGVLSTLLVGSIGVSALAATGAMTITVDPINVQVNGEVFAPRDVNGQDVPVFVYNGTTYAPLRALAEAYGLEVGYDAHTNMATVTGDVAAPGATTPPVPDTTAAVNDYSDWTAEEEAAYQEFKEMWEVEVNKEVSGEGISYYATHTGNARTQFDIDLFTKMAIRLTSEKYSGSGRIIIMFKDNLGWLGTVDGTSYEFMGGGFDYKVDGAY